MQLTDEAIDTALRALREHPARAVPAAVPAAVRARRHPALPGGLLDHMRATPALRAAEVTRARASVTSGQIPLDGAALARALVGRLVCERLR